MGFPPSAPEVLLGFELERRCAEVRSRRRAIRVRFGSFTATQNHSLRDGGKSLQEWREKKGKRKETRCKNKRCEGGLGAPCVRVRDEGEEVRVKN